MGNNIGRVERRVAVKDMDEMVKLLGSFDEHLTLVQAETFAKARVQDTCVLIEGDEQSAELAKTVLEKLLVLIRRGENIDKSRVRYAISLAQDGQADQIVESAGDIVGTTQRGRQVKTRTYGQQVYVQAMRRQALVFAIGPAGTGKTYLAVAMAVRALKNKEISRIILTRPAVEAGEKLGFLPGDLQEKVDPYLRPLYDALYDFLGAEGYKTYAERGMIEVAPLAYMRGRTLRDAYIILDEAQNATESQMKMFLTRFGEGARVVVTGDITQIDLPDKRSGLVHAARVLENVEDIGIVRLTQHDVVRHELVQQIISAYERYDQLEVEQ